MIRIMPFGYGPYGGGNFSASEASQHASAWFAQFDVDGDDLIIEDEYMDSAPQAVPMGRRNTERLYVNRAARFKSMDTDTDGKVTLAEFMVKAQSSFEMADASKDGKVTVWEFRSQQSPF